ncbi:MAG: 16S rRNA (cytosine(1402)-N(4))-methyltransferase RsmH [Mycobacteriales bacterium]
MTEPVVDGAAHVPVLLDQVVALLAPALLPAGAVLVDATVGLGGHAAALLDAAPTASLVGLDRDPEALQASSRRLARFGSRVLLVHGVYDELPAVLARLGHLAVQGVLLDLGVSSLQLDRPHRGFSYAVDAPLDMRMDPDGSLTAAEVVNTYPVERLRHLLHEYGEERFAARIAAAIVRERAREPFSTSGRLVELVRTNIPAATRRTGGNPAKRTFQALRIEVNQELAVLERALPAAIAALAVGGRLVILAYHSLEDRLAKGALRQASTLSIPPDLPVVPETAAPALRLLTRGAVTAGPAEVAANPRSRSARLRAAERVRAAA